MLQSTGSIATAIILNSLGIEILGVFDDKPLNAKLKTMAVDSGIRVQGDRFPKLDAPLIISVGDNVKRAELDKMLRGNTGYGQAIHGTTIISNKASISEETVILQGAIVQSAAKVGRHVLINTAASVDRDNEIGDYAHIALRTLVRTFCNCTVKQYGLTLEHLLLITHYLLLII